MLHHHHHCQLLLLLLVVPTNTTICGCAVLQVVDEVFDAESAAVMGLSKGSVCIMIHSGSRGLGHQVGCAALHLFGAD
jgi:hypothetical protein